MRVTTAHLCKKKREAGEEGAQNKLLAAPKQDAFHVAQSMLVLPVCAYVAMNTPLLMPHEGHTALLYQSAVQLSLSDYNRK